MKDLERAIGPTQVKYQLFISSIFDALNFRKMLEIHCIKNARNEKLLVFDLRLILV